MFSATGMGQTTRVDSVCLGDHRTHQWLRTSHLSNGLCGGWAGVCASRCARAEPHASFSSEWLHELCVCTSLTLSWTAAETASWRSRKDPANSRLQVGKGVRLGKKQLQFWNAMFSGIYSPLMKNIKSEISPMP